MAAVLGLVFAAGGALAGPTTVKVITEDGPAAGVEVWVYDAESGEKLRYGRTNDVGEVEFDDLEDNAKYEAQTLDGAHRTEVFTSEEAVVPLALDGEVPIMPVPVEEAVAEEVVEEAAEEAPAKASSDSPWGVEVLVGVGGGASSFDYKVEDDATDPLNLDLSSADDGIYGMGMWQVGVQAIGPAWLIFLENPRPFVRISFEGDINDSPEKGTTGSVTAPTAFNWETTLQIETKFRLIGTLGVAIPMELFGQEFELEPFLGFGAEWYTARFDLQTDNIGNRDRSKDATFVVLEPGVSASMPVWEYGPMELRAFLGLAADIYLGEGEFTSSIDPALSATYSRSFNIKATLGVKARFDDLGQYF
jgi:hypothetical protein